MRKKMPIQEKNTFKNFFKKKPLKKAALRTKLSVMNDVTVIIPAYNEEKVIDECLASLVTQSVKNFKAIIIDDASTDATVRKIKEFSQKFPDLIELRQYGKVGPGKARNIAAREVSSEFIAFMDADCIATPRWLEELLKGFTDPSVGSVGGPHIAPLQSSSFQLYVEDFFIRSSLVVDFYKPKKNEIIEVPHNPLCNVAYRRGVFQAAKGFREDLFPGEDTEIDFKVLDLQYKIFYNPQALVYHHRPENIEQFKKVMHAYGRAQGKLIREYGLRRKIQKWGILAIALLTFSCAYLIAKFLWIGLLASAVILGVVFFIRPKWNSKLGIYMNAFQWFNGLIEGLITMKSLPPGYQAKKKAAD
ncbi:MAG: glycosyl transferase [Bacteriovoracaceae bacterium]|nr:glycosyl transferase [Bacteriovoracaceae bacterium]